MGLINELRELRYFYQQTTLRDWARAFGTVALLWVAITLFLA